MFLCQADVWSLTLYSLNSPFTVLGSTGTQWTFTLVLLIFDTLSSVGAADGSDGEKNCISTKETRKDYKSVIKYAMLVLTVFPRVTNDYVWLRAVSKVIDGLYFDFIRDIDVCIMNNVLCSGCGYVIPLFLSVLPSPWDHVSQVWSIPFCVLKCLWNVQIDKLTVTSVFCFFLFFEVFQ